MNIQVTLTIIAITAIWLAFGALALSDDNTIVVCADNKKRTVYIDNYCIDGQYVIDADTEQVYTDCRFIKGNK